MSKLARLSKDSNSRFLILAGVIAFIGLYYYVFITNNKTILQNTSDWGIDQGQTMLFWAVVLIAYVLFMIVYAQQNILRQKQITKLHATIMGTWLFLPMLFIFFLQWFSHAPELNLYKLQGTILKDFDKFAHFGATFLVVVLFGLAFKRNPVAAMIIVYLIVLLFELFEIIVNFYLIELGLNYVWAGNPSGLMSEIGDVMPDIIMDTLGAIGGYFVVMRRRSK